MATATVNLEYGNLHPLDVSAGDSADSAHSAARGVVAMLQDNAEIESILAAMDEQTASDLVSGMADIIREAIAADEASPAEDESPADAEA
jgi:hypothetical protein